MKRFLFALLMACTILQAGAVKKQNLRILYVGGAPDIYQENEDTAAIKASVKSRTAAFTKLLKQYFTSISAIDAKQYNYKMSYDYDVTIFDGKPKPITPSSYEYDESGKIIAVNHAKYFPEDFNCAVLCIAEASETVGRGIGSKNDWYCLCLDADAHSWNAEHDIFKGPFKVKMTIKEKPTPEDAKHYAYFQDYTLPETLPMWRVQTKGYADDKNMPIGMVSRPWGYTDSPDCEAISSGVCAKTIDAVAIGRHGNFFHWGFAASPAYMTEEAKPVFANAVAYIAKFKGTHLIARKFDERTATKEYLKEAKELATRASWKERLESDKKWQAELVEEQKAAREKKARGEKLSKNEEYILNFKPEPPMSYSKYLARYQKVLFDIFGEDEQAYLNYYDVNAPYICGDKSYDIYVDNDAKAWKIANTDIRLIEKAITTLEADESGKELEPGEADRAKRILKHYTLCRFQRPSEWRQWFETYKDKMFFTQSGGWKWLINTQDISIPGNDYSILSHEKNVENAAKQAKVGKKQTATKQATKELKTDHNNPVALAAHYDTEAKAVILRMKLHAGYHTYNKVSDKDPYIPTTIKLTGSKGMTIGEPVMPKSAPLGTSGTTIFEDDCTFSYPITGSGTVEINIEYQCCDSNICFPPQNKKITVEVNE